MFPEENTKAWNTCVWAELYLTPVRKKQIDNKFDPSEQDKCRQYPGAE